MAGLTLDELKATAEFQMLTEKQQNFISAYITNGYQVIPAIRAAYVCKDDHTAPHHVLRCLP